MPSFHIYRSSAGSGKTYNLAREYLKLALERPDNFRHILAVTFTNKATHEMKSRIIGELSRMATGDEGSGMARELEEQLHLNPLQLQERSMLALRSILHDYSRFAVSTIDSFFQKVVQGFARELGLQGGFEVELDLDRVLEEVTDLMFLDLENDSRLLEWLMKFTQSKLEEARDWDVRRDILELGREIFKESFQSIREQLRDERDTPGRISGLRDSLAAIKFSFENEMDLMAREGIKILEENHLDSGSFAFGSGGPAAYFSSVIHLRKYEYGSRIKKALTDAEAWVTRNSPERDALLAIARDRLMPALKKMIDYYEKNKTRYYSATELYRFLYSYGLLTYLSDKLGRYRDDHGVILISDVSRFLGKIIGDNDTPFIYEKAGLFFNHFLIDEFQDTSRAQWENFSPLIRDSLAQGRLNMAVGDVKQSIYRWRGGDWRILDHDVEERFGKEYVSRFSLNRNWRSRKNIVQFNNAFFSRAIEVLKDFLESESQDSGVHHPGEPTFPSRAYADVLQELPPGKTEDEGGYVNICFLPEDDDQESPEKPVLIKLPSLLEWLQDQGFSLGETAILVRNNKEGSEVAATLLEYASSPKAKKGYRYDIISSESLMLGSSASANLLVNALRFILDPADQQVRLNLVYYITCLNHGNPGPPFHERFKISLGSGDRAELSKILPERFLTGLQNYRKMPLGELVTLLISDLQLETLQGEFPYLLGFQDAVRQFSQKQRSDISRFLEWWQEEGAESSITLPESQDSARILTIHKAKGLEFRVVIIPFCTWKFDPDSRKNNILWLEANKTLPGQDVRLPVKYSRNLQETFYSTEFDQERSMSYIDHLNLMYVAFTRASEALFVFAPAPKASGTKSKPVSADKLLYPVVESFTEGRGKFKISKQESSQGNWVINYVLGNMTGSRPKREIQAELTLGDLSSSRWQTKLSFRKSAENIFSKNEASRKSQINKGIAVHEILSAIIRAGDLPSVFDEVRTGGVFDAGEAEEIRHTIEKIIHMPEVEEWFSGKWEVRTEVPVIPAPGELSRMDRVMIRGQQAIVVDYKTGKPAGGDRKQVEEYKRILKEMDYQEVEGYLLYTDEGKLVKV